MHKEKIRQLKKDQQKALTDALNQERQEFENQTASLKNSFQEEKENIIKDSNNKRK
jgi:hypothetical protein